MSEAPPNPGVKPSVVRGIWRLGRLRREGFAEFTASRQAFLNSLAPLIAFPLVGGLLMLFGGAGAGALVDLLATLVALLAPPVISAFLAELWRRDAAWLRYAVAFNWCQWAVPLAAVLILVAMAILTRFGLDERQAAIGALFGIAGYGVTLHWFLARNGLGLSRLRTTLFVIAVNLGTVILVLLPRVLTAAAR